MRSAALGLFIGLAFPCVLPCQDSPVLRVGSKNFTESAVLAEVMAQCIEERIGATVERRVGLGGTMICWDALRQGEIDLYAEYTGTAWTVLLGEERAAPDPLQTYLRVQRDSAVRFGVRWLQPFGLDNTYALAMPEATAERLGVRSISDLLKHGEAIRAGFSVEFSNRPDGYPGLAEVYGLGLRPRTMEHGLAYEAVASGAIDLIDAYSTDGKLLREKLRILTDDRSFFPPYQAAPIVRAATLDEFPELESVLDALAFRIGSRTAQALNYVVEAGGQTAAAVARAFLEREGLVEGARPDAVAARSRLDAVLADRSVENPLTKGGDRLRSRLARLPRLVAQHLALTGIAVALAVMLAVPLGVAMTRRPRLAQIGLGVAGVLQTIPSLALLAFMIPLLGLSAQAAVVALFLYALLPILRNTHAGILSIDASLVDAARGLGMSQRQALRYVELPLAMPTIVAGVRVATVIGLGVATLAAFVGAGGLGEPIVEGLYLNDTQLILLGAVPAAALALLADAGMGFLERKLPGATRTNPSARSES